MNFNFSFCSSLFFLLLLIIFPFVGVVGVGQNVLFGIVIPYVAVAIFLIGFLYRVLTWARSPVPFKIQSTCGQQKTLPWIKHSKLENPSNSWEVFGRMFLEIFFFRSLFRNVRVDLIRDESKAIYWSSKWLWFFSILFHYAFLIVLLRHLRFFTDPVLSFVHILEKFGGFLEIGVPIMYLGGIILLVATIVLLLRRIFIRGLRYISLPSDYFSLFLIIGIAATGILMRYFTRVDIVTIKELTMGLVTFNPVIPQGDISPLFYIHLFLVSFLFIYFPFTKLMHMGGIFLSPTRNSSNNNRMVRHVNPWNPEVEVHTYEEYEEEFREKMKKAGLPLEKE